MLRREIDFPDYLDREICSYLKKIWEDGWLDDYSDNHFLIRTIEKRLTSFAWDKQFLFNNIRIYNVVGTDGEINYDILCENFCYNFSTRLQRMALIFGEDKIKKFILDQLSAGKHTYNEDAFFQAFSEIEVLSFFHRGFTWKEIQYEPVTGKNGENPEAYFIGELKNKDSAEVLEVKANIEVKTPKFPDLNSRKDKILIPTVLLTPSGRTEILQLCNSYNVEYVPPRINKLVEFINSATKKFNYPKKYEYNLLYINWSYSDFPSNSFLEAWSLLTNKYNGLLTHPEIGTTLPIKEPVNPDAYKKITAIIVYSSSIEQLMFCDFSHVWQRAGAGCKFRMFVLDEKLREAELNNDSDLLFQITGMNPDPNATHTLLLSYTPTSPDDRIISENFSNESLKLVLNNVLLNNE